MQDATKNAGATDRELDLLFQGLHTRFDSIDARVRDLHADHMELATRVAAITNRVDLIEQIEQLHRDKLEISIRTVETAMHGQSSALEELRTQFTGAASRIILLLSGALLSTLGAFALLVINKVL